MHWVGMRAAVRKLVCEFVWRNAGDYGDIDHDPSF